MSIWFYTKNKQWLDVLEFTLSSDQPSASSTSFDVYSFSAGIVPASVPFAALIGALLWWVPFSDVGQNRAHVLSIRDHVRSKGVGCEVERPTKQKRVAAKDGG